MEYIDISGKVSVPEGWTKNGAYCENGCVLICVSVPSGYNGSSTFSITDEKYWPRTTVGGVYAGFSIILDSPKFVAGRILQNGIGSIWFESATVYACPVTFCYPVRH